MIATIEDLIEALQQAKRINGNILVRTEIQIKKIIEVDYYIDKFYNESKTVSIPVLVFKGYKE